MGGADLNGYPQYVWGVPPEIPVPRQTPPPTILYLPVRHVRGYGLTILDADGLPHLIGFSGPLMIVGDADNRVCLTAVVLQLGDAGRALVRLPDGSACWVRPAEFRPKVLDRLTG